MFARAAMLVDVRNVASVLRGLRLCRAGVPVVRAAARGQHAGSGCRKLSADHCALGTHSV